MKIHFIEGQWETALFHAYTMRFPFTPKVIQEKDCIRNGTNSDMTDGFDYVSLLTKDKYSYNTKVSATCSFEKFGAPALLLTDTLKIDDTGTAWYGSCYEIVLYEKGINVWKHYMVGNEVRWVKLLFAGFPVSANSRYELHTTILENGLEIALNDRTCFLRIDDLPAKMHVGITACENINRFYDFSVCSPADHRGGNICQQE